jgi:hypothetical protein
LPCKHDVLLIADDGAGNSNKPTGTKSTKPTPINQEYPGNRRLRELVENNAKEYDGCCSAKGEKAAALLLLLSERTPHLRVD